MDYKEKARKRAVERRTSVWYKLVEGDNTFRILPTPESKTTDPVFIEYRMHREVGPDKKFVRCGKDPVSDDGSCWICDSLIPKLKKTGKEARATALVSRDVCAVQVAKVDGESMSGPLIWNPSKTVADQLIASVFASKKRDYADPKKGYNLTINRTGTGRNDTRYGIIEPDTDPSPVPEAIVKKLKAFSELKEIPGYNEAAQKAAYEGRDAVVEEEEDEEEEEKETVAEDEEEEEDEAPAPVVKKKAKPVVVEEDEEEEEPAPVKKPVGKKAPVVVEEDDEEEEEEPVKPVKKKSKVVVEEEEDIDDEEISLDDLEEEEEDEAPPPPPKKKVKK